MEIETPIYKHVYDYENVYEPAEDTFLLLDTLEGDREAMKAINPAVVLEVGCGSGLVSAFVAKIFGNTAFYLGTDVNPSATNCCMQSGNVNRFVINPITTNFVDGLLPRLKHKVDILLFNPPYVVTSSEEIEYGGIALAWAGGVKGREVMDKFFDLVPELLSQHGFFYLVALKENDPQEIIKTFRKSNIVGRIMKTRKCGLETLSVLRFCKINSNCS